MKIICIGKNYVEHAKEMNSDVPVNPVFFLKPDTALLGKGQDFYYPEFTNELHYEAEIVLKICKNGKHIDEKYASSYYNEIGLGIDFTARDKQDEAKKKGLPWEIAKAFDNAAVISDKFILKSDFETINAIPFSLKINNNLVQSGNTQDLIFSFDKVIAYVSKFITLKQGDYLFTGTPKGVGPVKIGDHLQGFIDSNQLLDFFIK